MKYFATATILCAVFENLQKRVSSAAEPAVAAR
jgi:hypothetical protein